MRNTRKIIVALMLVFTMLMSMTAIFASAATPETLYLTPNANWKKDNARFAAYFFGNGEKWVSMTDPDGDGVYEVAVPSGYPNVIFCRMNPSATANNWNNKWNQTGDLAIPTDGPNHYTINAGSWDQGTWSTYGSTCAHANLGDAATCTTAQVCNDCGDPVVSALGHNYNADHLCSRCNSQASFTVAGTGAHLGTEWTPANTANDMTYADGVYTKVYTNVAAGSYLLKVARDHDWGTAYPSADKAYTVATAGSTVTVTLKGTTVTVTVEAPHVHSWSDATCTEAQKCECGETQGEALGHTAGEKVYAELDVSIPACTAERVWVQECTVCGEIVNSGSEEAPGHTFVDGVCSVCQTADPDYVACEHDWAVATCTAPKTCALCDATEGEALGHTPGAEATCTAAQTCTVCGVELAPTIPHVDANLDITCDYDGCTKRILPPADSKVSLFTANHMIIVSLSNSYYVEGVVTEVVDAKNGNFIITDEAGDQLFIRMPVDANGVSHSSWQMKVVVGDVVSVYGKPKSTSGWNTSLKAGIQSGVLTFIDQHDHVANGNTVCTKDTLCACGAVVVPATGHIDADVNGLCDNCNWDMNLVEVNIAIGTDSKYNGVRVDDDAGKALSWTWSDGGFDAVIAKGTSTVTLYTTAKDYMQLKKQNTLTIANKEGVTVKYVTISVTTANYLNTLKTAIGSQYEFTADEANLTVTIQLNSTDDFVLNNQSTSTIYVNGVSIVYAKKGAHVHDYVGTVTTPATCTEAGVKTYACECGEGTYTEAIEALGHSFVDGKCSVCDAEDPNYVPPCAHKDTGLDAKCDVCGEYFVPASPFKLEMYQHSKGGTYYFKGSMSGYYFATTNMNDISGAVDVYAEEVDGGYHLYFLSGETKNYLYIQLNGTYTNIKYGSTQAVWAFNTTYGTFTTVVSGTTYYMGTYSTYVTISASKFSYVTESNVDVSQFVVRPVSLADHECVNTTSKVTAPTCTAEGYTTYTCADCGQSTKGDYVEATGHLEITTTTVDATCFENGYTKETCATCGHEVSNTVIPMAHAEATHVEAVAPTCYENGNIEYWYCEACGQAWLDADCTLNTNLLSVVLPMAHAEATHVEAKAATCYENGNIEYWYCEACGQAWLDEACTLNTNLKAVVLPMAHAEATHVEAKAATCYEDGNIEYWYCEACGQAWLDEACTLNTNLKAVVLPMAHAEATHVEAKAPTATENGNIEYWYCEACGQAWLDEACTLNTNLKAVVLPMIEDTTDETPETPDETPDETPSEPVEELNFFEKIWLAIINFFKKLFGLA